jgi:hypothetical protein
VRVQGQRSTEVEYAPGTLCATVRRSGYRQVLVIWLGQSNSPARTPAVNALGLKASAGPVGPQIWLPAPHVRHIEGTPPGSLKTCVLRVVDSGLPRKAICLAAGQA